MNDDIDIREHRTTFVSDDPPLLDVGPAVEELGAPLNPAQHGYTMVHNYALYFWRPYLGSTAFALWELLLSFCHAGRDTAYPSISRLARILSNSDHSRAVLTGRNRAKSRDGKRGRSRRQRVKERHKGALDTLRRERLVQLMRRGRGQATRYTFRVLQSLPLLSPVQVQQLSPGLQRDHRFWLQRYGIHEQAHRQAFAAPASPSDASPDPPDAVGDAPGTSRDATGDGGAAPGDGGDAPRSTNITHEKDYPTIWWKELEQELRHQLERSTFDTCVLGAKVLSFQEGVLTVQARGEFARHMLQDRLTLAVQRTMAAVSDGEVREVRFVCQPPGKEGEPCAP